MSSLAVGQPGVVNRRILLVTVGFIAAAAAGLVNNFSTLMLGAGLVGTQWWQVVVLAAPIAAIVLLRLFPQTAWAGLLVAGGLLALPGVLAPKPGRIPAFGDYVLVVTTLISPTLLLMGVLAAAAWVGQSGFRGLGALLGALTVAMPTLGHFMLSPLEPATGRGVFVAISLCGAIGALSMLRFLSGRAETRPDWRLVIVGCTVSLLPLLNDLMGEWFPIPALVLTLAAVASAGARPAVGTLIIALAGAGTSTTVAYVMFQAQSDALVLISTIAGFLVGLVGAVSRYRVEIAMAGLFLLGVLVLISAGDSRSTHLTYAVPLAFLLVAGIVSKTGAVTDLLRAKATSPIVIGVAAPLLTNAIFIVQLMQNRARLVPASGSEVVWAFVSGVMLLVAAVLMLLLKRLSSVAPGSELPVDVPESTV